MIYVIAIGCLYYLWFVTTGIGIPCLFRTITGWLCPGCGITTLLVRLSRLDIQGAYTANPFLFVTGPMLIAFALYDGWQRKNHKVAKLWQNVAIGLYLIGLIGFGIWRNVH